MTEPNYDKSCFVIMPFGKKRVGEQEVDFDFIYHHVFKPAIAAVELPADEGGGTLQPRRTDQDYFSSDISQDMFEYIEYARFALADISGLNANVFYELGVRHRAHESGTAIFHQESGPPPFDIGQIKAFPYAYQPQEKITESIDLIKRVLTESLIHNRLDSPPRRALRAQREQEGNPQCANIEPLLIEADNAMRLSDWTTAIARYSDALSASPHNPMVLMKRGLIYRDQGLWDEAIADFQRVVDLSPEYAEAHRERGIAENKAYNGKKAHAKIGQHADWRNVFAPSHRVKVGRLRCALISGRRPEAARASGRVCRDVSSRHRSFAWPYIPAAQRTQDQSAPRQDIRTRQQIHVHAQSR